MNKKKVVIVAWHKVCSPYSEGGLRLRSLRQINDATVLKLCWEFYNSHTQWASLLRSRVVRKRGVVSHHIFSSIWPGIKSQISVVEENCGWQLGNGADINFWTDLWLFEPLVSMINSSVNFPNQLSAKVKDFITNGK